MKEYKTNDLKKAIDRIKPETAKNRKAIINICDILDAKIQTSLKAGKNYACYSTDDLSLIVSTLKEVANNTVLHIQYLNETTRKQPESILSYTQRQNYMSAVLRVQKLEKLLRWDLNEFTNEWQYLDKIQHER